MRCEALLSPALDTDGNKHTPGRCQKGNNEGRQEEAAGSLQPRLQYAGHVLFAIALMLNINLVPHATSIEHADE